MATIRVTQHVLEVLTVDAAALSAAPISGIQVTQILFEVLTAGGTSTATSLTGHLLWAYSGASGLPNAIIRRGTPVSAEWIVSGGTSAYTYTWTFGQVTREAEFVSTATTSIVTRTYSHGGGELGRRTISGTLSDAGGTSFSRTFFAEYRKNKATFHASPPTGASPHLARVPTGSSRQPHPHASGWRAR